MQQTKEHISIFKPWLKVAVPYTGGKSKNEIPAAVDKIYKLSSNENPIGASPKAMQAIRRSLHNLHEYPDRTDQRLRAALSEYYGGQLEERQFIATSSGSEILEHTIRAFAGPGLEVIVSNPCFLPYQMFSQWAGAKVVDVPLLQPDFRLDIEGILNAVTDNTRLLFLTSPNNPTGTYIPKKDIDRLFEKLPQHVVTVFDEVYWHFVDAEDYTTALPYVQQGRRVIGVNSFSKTWGLAGMRIGYCYTTVEIADYIHQICKPFLVDTLSIEAGLAALQDAEFIKKTVDLVQRERPYLYRGLDKLGVKYWPSQGNFIMLEPTISEEEFEQRMMEQGVMVRPVGSFGAPGCIRVTVGKREANRAFLRALERIV